MSAPVDPGLRQTLWSSVATVATSSATLICCALPALLVSLGAGAVLAGLVSTFPALIWLSAHKALVFGVAAVLLLGAGVLQWRARSLPCPLDPVAAGACMRVRRWSTGLYSVSVAIYLVGAVFAFILPGLML